MCSLWGKRSATINSISAHIYSVGIYIFTFLLLTHLFITLIKCFKILSIWLSELLCSFVQIELLSWTLSFQIMYWENSPGCCWMQWLVMSNTPQEPMLIVVSTNNNLENGMKCSLSRTADDSKLKTLLFRSLLRGLKKWLDRNFPKQMQSQYLGKTNCMILENDWSALRSGGKQTEHKSEVLPYGNKNYLHTGLYWEEWTQQVKGSDDSLYSALMSLHVQFHVQNSAF